MNAKQKPTQRNEKWGQKRRLTRHTGNQPGKPHGTCRIQKERNTRMPSVNQKNPKTRKHGTRKMLKDHAQYQVIVNQNCLIKVSNVSKHKEECY